MRKTCTFQDTEVSGEVAVAFSESFDVMTPSRELPTSLEDTDRVDEHMYPFRECISQPKG